MNRVRCLGFVAGALAFLALTVPGSALAGTYTWNLASDFTATVPGANPDHDQYGGTPWSYAQGSTDSFNATTTFSPLANFKVLSGLSGWSASPAPPVAPLVGINDTASPITAGNYTFPPGQIVVEPGSSHLVAVGWTSPLSQTATVSINGAVSADAAGCTYATTWTIEQNGTALASNTLPSATDPSGSFSTHATVAAGGSIYLTVSTPPADANCSATGVVLDIAASGTAPPVTLATPVSGSSSTVNNPTFSGAARTDFGDGSQVTLRVYSGVAVSGTPVAAVTVPRSGASWSTRLPAPLPLGTYTAQAEQDDVASPADAGVSAPVTFSVRLPVITLDPLGSRPLTTSTPTLTGTADNDVGSDPFAAVEIFSGATTAGAPVAKLATTVAVSGQFSVQVTPALADGTYTVVAVQADEAGTSGFSAPQTFDIDTQPPTVTLVRPARGARADFFQLVFTGAAGNASFDARVVTVTLYRGKHATGKQVGALQAKVTGSTWSGTWPGTLAPGVYTALASQTDVVGHVGLSAAHTFRVLPLPPVIGAATINRAGRVSVQIACNEPVGDTCSGTVLVLTRAEYQPLAGGPVGRLTVMFAYVHVPGAQAKTITRTALASVAAVLRHDANVAVTISANLRPVTGQAIHARARASLRRLRG